MSNHIPHYIYNTSGLIIALGKSRDAFDKQLCKLRKIKNIQISKRNGGLELFDIFYFMLPDKELKKICEENDNAYELKCSTSGQFYIDFK
ncbi:MAG: hypothetical protein U9P72_04135 [Campylobacterota bacterium]|nr:hypothetical protein [Campylobacterota bacterium]